jgi:hypothetical protein
VTGNDTASAIQRPETKPGDTRFWCSCDPQQPYLDARELIRHVTEARAREAGHDSGASR